MPRPIPRTVTRFPVTDTVATDVSPEDAVTVCVSLASASVTVTSLVAVEPLATPTSAIASTAGRLFGTVAVNVTAAEVASGAPLSSVARTVTVAVPPPTPRTVTRFPDTDTVATDASPEDAVTVCVSSASASVTVTSLVAVEPLATSTSAIASTTGRLFGTVAVNVTAAEVASGAPLSSLARTVTVAVPPPTPRTVTRFPDTDTVATDASPEDAVTVCVSSASASVTVTSLVAVEPFPTSTSAIAPTAGRLFGTVTVNVTGAEVVAFDAPLLSVACTVTVAVPRPIPRTVIRFPVTDTVATDVSPDAAVTVCVSSASASVTVTSLVAVEPLATSTSVTASTTGRLFGTVAVNVTAAEVASGAPLSSIARTVTVAVPPPTPRTVTRFPDTDTVATDASPEDAVTVCVSSASASVTVTSLVAVEPLATSTSVTASTTGRLFGTVAVNVRAAEVASGAPLSSVARTVTVAVPPPTPRTVTRFPDTDTVATDASPEDAVTVCVSSASASVTVTSLVAVEPFSTSTSAIASTAGRLFGTVTVNVRAAEVAFGAPLSSVACTVTVAVPRPIPRTVTRFPVTDTVATDVLPDAAVTVCVSSASASVTVTSTADVEPFDTVRLAIAPTAGRVFDTVTVNVTAAEVAFDAPLLSLARTVTVALPRPTPRTVTRFPDTDTVATDVLPDAAVTVCVSLASASVTVTSRTVVEPFSTSTSAIAATTGRLFDDTTVTRNITGVDVAFEAPVPSPAVTRTSAPPTDSAVSVSSSSDTDTPTTAASDDSATTVCVCDVSASVTVTVTVTVAPSTIVRSAIADTAGPVFTSAKPETTSQQFRVRPDASSSERNGGDPVEQDSSVKE